MKKKLALLEIYLIISLAFVLSISLSSPETKADEALEVSCCKEANNDQTCVSNLAKTQCKEGKYVGGVDCDNEPECNNRGCCKSDGICTSGVPQGNCQGENKEYYSNPSCDVDQCKP